MRPKVFFIQNLGFIAPTETRRLSLEETVHFEETHEEIPDVRFRANVSEPWTVEETVRVRGKAIG